ncbi:MAG: hypothetical protein SZ59_C0001G0011 [candidate division TM6 bacterium GW2011_GWF2_28_16]|nr:MAG: hypothetical protein SZ59_C0001G0011 [candidate division TM6 bacterium GW2011_GWF2_28_16]
MSFRFFSTRFLQYIMVLFVFSSYCLAQENLDNITLNLSNSNLNEAPLNKESKVFNLFNTLRSDLQVEKTKIELFENYFTQLNDLLKDEVIPKIEKLEKLNSLVGNLEALLNDDYFFSGLTIDLKEKINLLSRLLVIFIKAENLDWETIEKDYTSISGALDAITKYLEANEKKLIEKDQGLEAVDNQEVQTKGIDILVNNQIQKQVHINKEGVLVAPQIVTEGKTHYKKVGNNLFDATIKTLGDFRNGGLVFAFAKNLLEHHKKSNKNEVKV